MTHEGNTPDGGEQVQPGGRVSKATYDRFREFVRRQHGSVRGNLGTELEKAMEDRMETANNGSSLARIENDVATIKAMLADGESLPEADGGEAHHTDSEPEYTHTRGDGQPPANAPVEKKLAYLAHQVERLNNGHGPDMIPRAKLRDIVKSEYGFRSDTAKRYVERLVDHFGLCADPRDGYDTLVSTSRREEIIEAQREDLEAEAEAKL